MSAADLDLQRAIALRAIHGNLLRLKWHAAALRFELALRRHDRALKYHPDQPRVPAGVPEGGRWAGTDPTASGESSNGRIRLAGEIPTNDPPEVPKERPKTSPERSAVLKAAARWLGRFGGPIGKVIEVGSWAYNYLPLVQSYYDPPRTFEELQNAVSTPEPGYDIHHIVEQSQAAKDNVSREIIDGPDNLVRIPTMKHWEINGWYQTPNIDYGRQTPRDYLKDRSWDERREVGLKALRDVGVLK